MGAVLLALVHLPRPAAAASTYLCTGYAACQQDGYSHFGYKKAGRKMWWRMYSGHNCTNYVAYRLVKGGMSRERPWSGTGMAYNWGRAKSGITDRTPMVGAVAWWKKNAPGVGSSGHVAYVEKVISRTRIIISEDSWSGDFHWRRLTKSSGSWPTGFIHFDDRAVEAQTRPAIAGEPAVGRALTASTGRWTPAATHRFQWLADGRPIAGATRATFTPTPLLRGKRLSVRVDATRKGYVDGKATSLQTARVARGTMAATAKPTLTGTVRVDEVIEVRPAAWSPTPDSVTLRWFADGEPIRGESGRRLHLTQRHIGAKVTVRMTARTEGYRASALTSAATVPVAAGRFDISEPFALAGVLRMGQRLSVSRGVFEPAKADVSYAWLRDGKVVSGATGPSYPLGVDDVGRRISARVTLRHPGYRDRTVVLAADGRVRTTPSVRVAADGRPGKAVVRVRVAAPGVATPTGRVTVRIGKREVVGRLEDGRVRLVLDGLSAGTRKVRVVYAGTEVVRAGRAVTTVDVPRKSK